MKYITEIDEKNISENDSPVVNKILLEIAYQLERINLLGNKIQIKLFRKLD